MSIAVLILLTFMTIPANAQDYNLNPYFKMYLTQTRMPSPVGIASYGLYQTTNGYSPFIVETDKIIAKTTINALQANVVQPQPNTPAYENYPEMPSANSDCNAGQEYAPSKDDVDNGANLQVFQTFSDVR